MTRSLRSAHRLLWLLLALTIGVGFLAALVMRPPEELPAAEELRK